MRLTLHTDYALRMLVYMAVRPGRDCTVNDVAEAYGLSRNHLLKVARTLRDAGMVETARGRSGGVRLIKSPEAIGVGDLLRVTEEDFALVECMRPDGGACVISPGCALRGALAEALAAYMAVLDRYTLADIARNRSRLGVLLGLDARAA